MNVTRQTMQKLTLLDTDMSIYNIWHIVSNNFLLWHLWQMHTSNMVYKEVYFTSSLLTGMAYTQTEHRKLLVDL